MKEEKNPLQNKGNQAELERIVAEKTAELAIKNRELEIEAALERVRSKTMAMHKSTDLFEVIAELAEQLQMLGFSIDSANFNTSYREKDWNLWLYHPGTPVYPSQIHVPYIDHPYFNRTIEGLEKGNDFNSFVFSKEEKDSFLDHLYENTIARHAPEERRKYTYSQPGFAWSVVYLKNTAVTIANYQAEPYTEEQNIILRRFGNVFEQSYTRFLDLQKAEQQAREARIEAGLERVRSRAMAMRHSEELKELIGTVFAELTKLDIVLARCIIMIYEPASKGSWWWMANSEAQHEPIGIFVQYHESRPYLDYLKAWEADEKRWTYELSGQVKKDWDDFLFSETGLSQLPTMVIEGMKAPEKVCLSASFNNFGNLTLATLEPLSDEHFSILLRFANVFNLTYSRFNDLQKAEASAREARIETGLERVRYSAMAMQSSEDVGSATAIMFSELSLLGVDAMRCGIAVIHPDRTADVWAATTTADGKAMKGMGSINLSRHPLWIGLEDAWKNKEESFFYALRGDDLISYYKVLAGSSNYDSSYIQSQELPDHFFHTTFFEQGGVFTFSLQPHDEEKRNVLKKFTSVFSLTFRRYLDLQKAEAQTREAEIQLALERVRARTMAMQRSEELAETCELLFEEFRKLNVVAKDQHAAEDRATIGIFNEANGTYDLWVTNLDGRKIEQVYRLDLEEPVNISKAYTAWKEGKPSLVVDMHGEELNSWLNYLQSIGIPVNPVLFNKRRINTWAFFSKGNLGLSTNEPLSEESVQLLQRFADTFNLTYTRFQDLKDAEARTQEAIKEASLDRVRAAIASMRTADDLQRITPSVWRELMALGVPFFRCGVLIIEEEKQLAHFYLTTPDGKPLAALELNTAEPGLTQETVQHWREQKMYMTHWSKAEFEQFAENLIARQQIKDLQTYQGGIEAPSSLSLQFMPFAQGMLYVGSVNDLSAEQLHLAQSLADAFSAAYARYDDFKKLETALKELRAAQAQLVQSEKMASLGELTAGIAHEIQNPLNFVNNFSEVSTDLVKEMNEEIQNGNLEDVQQIANDLKDNLSKINHHGKRASDIVRSMLLHSRRSNGQKELTDINALCDEYLRLAYHGLRAKDKTFNAAFTTDFDAAVPKMDIIPQDIGRVVLNLINNAFYAVSARLKKGADKDYRPAVNIKTSKLDRFVLIRVADNGTGIPGAVADKIFQPFFTTKPTGEGTGLGLSLSYDIVKAHGGDIQVETRENEGTEFIIQLPVNN